MVSDLEMDSKISSVKKAIRADETEMGCDTSKAESKEDIELQDNGDDFTDNQIDSIKSTWPLLSRNTLSTGLELFRLIFLTEPKIKSLFMERKHIHDEDILQNSDFKEHIEKFMQTLGHVVDTLDTNREESEQTLLLLGAKHGMIDGFTEDYFTIYSSCMIDTWESVIGEEFILEVKESWEALCAFITRFMREGYSLYQQETDKNESDNEAIV